MILPTKHIKPERSISGIGAKLLKELSQPLTLSALWEISREKGIERSYEYFILALDFLYSVGLIELNKGQLERKR